MVKTTKVKAHPLNDFYLVSFRTTEQSIVCALRTECLMDSNGFDIEVFRSGNVVKTARRTKGYPNPQPFEVNIEDVTRLIALAELIESKCKPLTDHKTEMLEAKLNNNPIKHLSDSTQLLEKIVEHISPVVRSISERSLSEKELVLKKVLEDDKREEIYLSKKELLDQIEDVPSALKHVFNPLGLDATEPLLKKPSDNEDPKPHVSKDPLTVINDDLTNQFISQERAMRVDTDDIVDDTVLDADTAPPPPSYETKISKFAEEAKRIVEDLSLIHI